MHLNTVKHARGGGTPIMQAHHAKAEVTMPTHGLVDMSLASSRIWPEDNRRIGQAAEQNAQLRACSLPAEARCNHLQHPPLLTLYYRSSACLTCSAISLVNRAWRLKNDIWNRGAVGSMAQMGENKVRCPKRAPSARILRACAALPNLLLIAEIESLKPAA